MCKAFDPRAKQTFGVLEVKYMRDRPEVVLMSFVDGGSVEFRRQLFLRVVSIVHPNFHEVRAVRSEVAHGLSGLLNGRDDIRHIISRGIVRSRSRPRQSTADGPEQSRAWMNFFSQLIGQVPVVGAHADGGGKSVVCVSLQMIEEILAIEVCFRHASVTLIEKSKVTVNINERGNDRLAAQVDASRTWRRLNLALFADGRETVVLHDKGRAFNRHAAVAHDQPCAFE